MDNIKRILLDTNMVIKAFDNSNQTAENQTQKIEITQQIRAWLQDDSIELSITPLIRFEVLNKPGMPSSRINKLNAAMDLLSTKEITNATAIKAAELVSLTLAEKKRRLDANNESHTAEQQRLSNLKLRFDAFHVATEIVHELKLVSNDSDIKLIQKLHSQTL